MLYTYIIKESKLNWLVASKTKARSIVDTLTNNTTYAFQDDKQHNQFLVTLFNEEVHLLKDDLGAPKEVGDLNQFHKTIWMWWKKKKKLMMMRIKKTKRR